VTSSENKTAREQPTQPYAARDGWFSPRLGGVLAYGFAVFVVLYGASLASNAYHRACAKEVTWAAADPFKGAGFVLIAIVVIIFPTLLARGKALVIVNLWLGLLTVVCAVLFLSTASTPPYECYTMGGSYEDHVSGLPEFTLYLAFVVAVSYFFVVLDWSIWGFQNLARILKRQ
jgi:uncharacterized protein (DUF983 family)